METPKGPITKGVSYLIIRWQDPDKICEYCTLLYQKQMEDKEYLEGLSCYRFGLPV